MTKEVGRYSKRIKVSVVANQVKLKKKPEGDKFRYNVILIIDLRSGKGHFLWSYSGLITSFNSVIGNINTHAFTYHDCTFYL